MGFGWVTLGYFFTALVSMTPLTLRSPLAIGLLVGYPMMIFGLYFLSAYQRYFRVAFFTSFLSIPLALYDALGAIGQMGFSVPDIYGGTLRQIADWGQFLLLTLITALVLFAISQLCRELGLIRHEGMALRNLLLLGLATLLDLVARLPLSFIVTHQGYFMTPALIMRLAIVILNLHLLFSCFRDICSQDEGMLESEKRRKEKKK